MYKKGLTIQTDEYDIQSVQAETDEKQGNSIRFSGLELKEVIDSMLESVFKRIWERAGKETANIELEWEDTKLELQEGRVNKFLELIFEKMLENEEKEVGDIKYLGSGGFSNVYKIGSKVIKISPTDRGTNQIPHNRRTIQPLIRMPIPKLKQKDETLLFIEIMEEAEIGTVTKEEATLASEQAINGMKPKLLKLVLNMI